MIAIAYDTATGVAAFSRPPVIKAGTTCRVTITFSTAPVDLGAIMFSLFTDTATPAMLAFTETFAETDEPTVYRAFLNTNDTRLNAAIAGKNALPNCNAELVIVDDGEEHITPNLRLTVQARAFTGPEASENGPTYLTETQILALLETGGIIGANGRKALTEGEVRHEVVFDVPFAAAPVMTQPGIIAPNDDAIFLWVVRMRRTAAGFTVWLNGAPTEPGFEMDWSAQRYVLSSPTVGDGYRSPSGEQFVGPDGEIYVQP